MTKQAQDERYTGPLPDHIRQQIEKADALIREGHVVFWKFTCRNCGKRMAFDVPNALHMSGQCEQCGTITNLLSHREADVGFAAVLVL